MIDPLSALIYGSLFMFAMLVLFFPVKGIFPRWKRSREITKRVLIEDGLKQIYESEYKRLQCSLTKFAKSLSISDDQARDLIDHLVSLQLVEWKDGAPKLTSQGEEYALRVIRIHRLWERYLADETSFNEKDWHPEAERREHNISIEEADKLAAQLGNPLFDPHGDPIPTASGELPKHTGKSLTEYKTGEVGFITHLEDEPPAVYAQLIAQGLQVGKQVKVLDVQKERIKFIVDGEECVLAPLLAENVTIKSAVHEDLKEDFTRLSSLKIGEQAKVVGISKSLRGQQRRRLMDLGIVPGAIVIADLASLGGDPVAYRIKGTTIALRTQQAEQIYIEEIEKESKVA